MPYLGDTTQGVDSFPNAGDRALLSSFVAVDNGSILGWQAYFDATSTAGSSVKFLLFDDNAGAPGNLLAASTGVAVPAGGGLVTGSLSGSIVSGATYWLGIVCNSFESRLSEDLSTGAYVRREGFSYASPPSTWPGTDASGNVQMNVALEYEIVELRTPIIRPLILRPRPFMPGHAR